jgi:hypothetical protein
MLSTVGKVNRMGNNVPSCAPAGFTGRDCGVIIDIRNMLDSNFSPNYGRFMKKDRLHNAVSIIC